MLILRNRSFHEGTETYSERQQMTAQKHVQPNTFLKIVHPTVQAATAIIPQEGDKTNNTQ